MSWQRKVEQRQYKIVANGVDLGNTSHRSEVVWKGSREVGMARARTPDGRSTYVVSRYRPAGNVTGEYEGNVFGRTSTNPPTFLGSKSEGEQSRRVERTWGNPGKSNTRVIVEETASYGPQGEKIVRTRTTWTTASSGGFCEKESGKKISSVTKREPFDDPTTKLKHIYISDKRNEDNNLKATAKQHNDSTQRHTTTSKPGDTSRPGQALPSGTFQEQALSLHNKYRRLHQVPHLRWNNELARDAQAWAAKIARQNTLRHASSQERKGDGENLAYFGGRFDDVAKEAVNMWYDEQKKYQYHKPGFKSGTGHFTQMVWKDSREVGMASAKSPDGRSVFVVARYRPAGNMMGAFEQNVFAPRK